jgi:hypothetical protein
MPPHLAGRAAEQADFKRLLEQTAITENLIITGLRGVGKTVLLNHMKPMAHQAGWLWAGEDMTEQSSLSEERIATRIITDLSAILGPIFVHTQVDLPLGFTTVPSTKKRPIGYSDLERIFVDTPGLVSDKLKAVFRQVGRMIANTRIRGIVFAYDEAQNMADHAAKDQFPLSLLLDVFQSVQRSPGGLPFILVLTGLPTIFPKLVSARTYSERMFHTIFLDRLSDEDAREAIKVPIGRDDCPFRYDDETVEAIVRVSGGYPYFIQFICRETFDVLLSKHIAKQDTKVAMNFILKKLDDDFFSARWDTVSDAQRNFLKVVAEVPSCEGEFSVSDVIRASEGVLDKPYASSSVTQYLSRLSQKGLVYRGSNGKYRFAVPLLSRFIRRQVANEAGLPVPFRGPTYL